MNQIIGSSIISHNREERASTPSDGNKFFTFACEHLPQMLRSDKITSEEKDILQLFHNKAAVRLKQIFDSKRYRDRFIYSIRGSIREANSVSSDENVSNFETLFHDTLKEIQVLKNFIF